MRNRRACIVCQASTDRFHLDARLRLNLFDFLALTVQTVLPFGDDLTVEEVVTEEARDDENIAYQARDHQQHDYDGESGLGIRRGCGSTALFSEEYDLHRFF